MFDETWLYMASKIHNTNWSWGRCQKHPERGGSLKFAAKGRTTLAPLKILKRTCNPPKTESNIQGLP